jgi:hypothetical protein
LKLTPKEYGAKDELPPLDAFWSVTMCDKDGYQAANTSSMKARAQETS